MSNRKTYGDLLWRAQLRDVFADPKTILGFHRDRTELIVSVKTNPFDNARNSRSDLRIDFGSAITAATLAESLNQSLNEWVARGEQGPFPGIRDLTAITDEPVRPSQRNRSGGSATSVRLIQSL